MYWQARFDQENPDQNIIHEMHKIRKEHKDFGCLRMTHEVREAGYLVNKKKVARLMKENGLNVTSYTRKSRKYSSYRGDTGKPRKNLIHRRFYTSVVHQKITTDTTEFKYYERDTTGELRQKKLYLDPFMDLFNSEILSFRISKRPNAKAVMDALEEAIQITDDCLYRRTFHSDRGWAYQMGAYQRELKKHAIFQSFSRKGNCLDNSPMENFFSLLKQEVYHGQTFHSYEELEQIIITFIDYYNHRRIKQKLDWMSPITFREKVQNAA
jgi:transposase InsO family protein